MPENSIKKVQRPTSDILLETGRKHLTQVEKDTVAVSNKQISMLLARSRSLDILSSANERMAQSKVHQNHNSNVLMPASSPSEERDFEQLNMYVANSSFQKASPSNSAESSETNDGLTVKDEPSSTFATPDKRQKSTLLKEKSELNNNNHAGSNNNERYHVNTNRSSCSSSISTASSSYSTASASKSNHNKLQRRSSSTLEGAAAFQEVVLKTEPIRMTGYLEKRSKVLGWKKFWFVLDGRLLTYYKSKVDYESLSACCGCINLGIASTVRPIQIRGCKGYPLQIVTRSQVYYLRSQEKPVLEQWLIAIQEAASSPPGTSVLTSWNSYSGSQYFRHSYSSQSQWSLNNSSDDISNITDRLGNLPDTFYQKRDRDSLALPNTSSQVSPVIHKYHSFASLQTPIINDFEDKRNTLISSSENLRDLQTGSGKSSSRNTKSTMQHSTSLLVLDSSPQAAELRKELTRKLSIGSTKNSFNDAVDTDDDTVPTPKFLLLSAKQKLQLGPSGDNESHDYAEIGEFMEGNKSNKPYENCDIDNNPIGNNLPQHQSVDKRSKMSCESAEKDGNIYEHVEAVECGPNSGVVWEPLNEGNNAISNNKRFPMHRMSAGSNRNSLVSISELPEDVSSISPSPIKTPMLTSIPEASWRSGIEPYKSYHKTCSEDDLSSSRSESFRSLPCVEKSGKKKKGKAFTGFLSKVFGKGKGKASKSESSMVISGPVDLRQREMQENKPIVSERNAPFTGGSSSEIINRNVVRTDHHQQVVAKTSAGMPGSRMIINNTVVMDELKQKVGHITLKRTGSKESNCGVESESPPKESESAVQNGVRPKVEPRVPYVPRSNSMSTPISPTTKQTPVLIFQSESKSFESNTDDDIVTPSEPQNEIQVASICMSPEYNTPSPETGELEETKLPIDEPVIRRDVISSQPTDENSKTDVDFQNKLAKFNRLSQKLSASFIAAAMNPALHPSHHIGRSQSYKAHKNKSTEVIPPLPPKKKNALSGGSSGAISIYDVPLNNKPVLRSESFKHASRDSMPENEGNTIAAYIRGITKKNSTPDIVISGNNAKLFGLRDDDPKEFRRTLNSNSNSEDSFDIHKSSSSLPPPRPPKPKPPTKPKLLEKGLNRSKRNSESSSTSSETIAEPPIMMIPHVAPPPMQTLELMPALASPATSNKSLLDIDTLDALSDIGLSDTKASNSPPDSPKICPLHPDAISRDDLSLSTIARTPDSILTIVSDDMVPDSLLSTPVTEILQASPTTQLESLPCCVPDTPEPISINKLEIVIRDNDGSPGLVLVSPDTESRLDSLERNTTTNTTSIKSNINPNLTDLFENIKFANVSTLIQEFETVQENEEEIISELYDDFPSEFYTPTPSSFSGYSPSEISSTTSTDSPISSTTSSSSMSSSNKKHANIDSIRNSGMEQLEAFLSFGSTTSSDACSFESCTDNFSEVGPPVKASHVPLPSTTLPESVNINNNIGKKGSQQQFHAPTTSTNGGVNRTGAISRLGHSSAIGHLQKILTSDVK